MHELTPSEQHNLLPKALPNPDQSDDDDDDADADAPPETTDSA